MNTTFTNKLSLLIIATVLLAVGSGAAQTYQLRATNRQVQTLLSSIEGRTDSFKNEMRRSFNLSSANIAGREDRIMDLIEEFEDSTDKLKQRFNSRQVIAPELSDVFNKAQVINSFMIRNRMTGRAETLWTAVRTDLNSLAGYYSTSWDWNQSVNVPPAGTTYPPFTSNEAEMRNLIRQIENKTNAYKNRMGNALDRSQYDGRPQEQEIMNYVTEFENATNRLRDRFNGRQSSTADASEVLTRGLYIDQFMSRNAFACPAENQWRALRNDLNTLASYYRVSWNWNQPLPTGPDIGIPGRFARLTGTYRLNRTRSDNVANIVNSSLRTYDNTGRENARLNLQRRLASPEMIAIDTNGRNVTMATSSSTRVEFDADGVVRTETNPRGRTVTTTATLNANNLEVNYTGDRMNDFYVTFSPSGRDQLVVTKRLYLEGRDETVTVSSIYDRVSNNSDWAAVNAGPVWSGGNIGSASARDFYVPNGIQLSATLRNSVSTRGSQIGDRFTMVVSSPAQYRGAVIEGRVAQARDSGRFTGRANMSLEFDTIALNGRTYHFAGLIDSVNVANGDTITVDNEGTIRDTSQTTQTATRAGIGAIVGAIIGAIAGGGEGAAIGAGVGAGAGAGSVLITGRDNIELGAGSTFNITATAPLGTRGAGAN